MQTQQLKQPDEDFLVSKELAQTFTSNITPVVRDRAAKYKLFLNSIDPVVDYDDLIQEGFKTGLEALDRWIKSGGNPYSAKLFTWAWTCIDQRLRELVRESSGRTNITVPLQTDLLGDLSVDDDTPEDSETKHGESNNEFTNQIHLASCVTEKHSVVLHNHYSASNSELGKDIGVTRQRVSQVRNEVTTKLRYTLQSKQKVI